jgi:hypothetical protein
MGCTDHYPLIFSFFFKKKLYSQTHNFHLKNLFGGYLKIEKNKKIGKKKRTSIASK